MNRTALATAAAALALLIALPVAATAGECSLLTGCTGTGSGSGSDSGSDTGSTPPTTTPPTTLPPVPVPTTQPPQPDTAAAARRLLELVNRERSSRGLGHLARRVEVEEIAVGHSRAMAARNDIWHNDAFFTKATKDRLGAQFLGENVAMNSNIDNMHQRLMNSPHHRDNILDPRFSQIGIGVAANDDGMLFATEGFLQPRTPSAAPAPKSKPAPKPAGPTIKAAAAPSEPSAPPVTLEKPVVFAAVPAVALPATPFMAKSLRAGSAPSLPPMAPLAAIALAALLGVVRFLLHHRSNLVETGGDAPHPGGG